MDEAVLRALKLVALLGVATALVTTVLWAYLEPALGLAGPMFAGTLFPYITDDAYRPSPPETRLSGLHERGGRVK